MGVSGQATRSSCFSFWTNFFVRSMAVEKLFWVSL